MKKIASLLVILLGLTVAVSAQAKWKELSDFHDIMSATFHPAEEGKLDPIKTRSQEMIDKAVAWKTSTAPEGFDKAAIKEQLKKLVKGSKELQKLIKNNGTDKQITKKLTALHDLFHEMTEKCKGEDHKQ